MLYLGVASTHEAQQHILHALTRKFQLDPMFNLSTLAVQCPFNYTGADFYALCSDAMLNAMLRKVKIVEERIGRFLVSFRLWIWLHGPLQLTCMHPMPLQPLLLSLLSIIWLSWPLQMIWRS
jgi:SpoVK/Ycf46/Vps4 family AAA+-type ATPase